MITYSKTDNSIVVMIDFMPKTIPASHPNFHTIVAMAMDPETEEQDLVPLIDLPKPVNQFSENIKIKNGQLFYKGYPVHSTLSTMILDLIDEQRYEAAKPYELFLEYAFANPDPRAATDLFDWVVNTGLPITPDGHILAWKAVRHDLYSIHTGSGVSKYYHGIGCTVEMPREDCDANPNQTCSSGLHFAAADYLPHYAGGGSRIVAVKICPTDVVAFPVDYGWSKGRACKYTIVGEIPMDKVEDYYPQGRKVDKRWDNDFNDYHNDSDDYDDEDDDDYEEIPF